MTASTDEKPIGFPYGKPIGFQAQACLRLNPSGSGLRAETDQFTVGKLIGFSP
ncbi:hypothetical protein [Streptomyces violarus]|uniref:hypothetical protein n=1 Tax=Streptomyces violarus TaxID=67380 RepID=UPI0021C03C22|nr:hypothetical protein [Streptomyces violarus]MCT9138182.1 hypothetical protein [Streptomyces violarus]